MPAIIDILSPWATDCQPFVATNASDSVVIAVPPAPYDMITASGNKTFRAGDSFQLLSIGLRLPESFGFYIQSVVKFQTLPVLQISAKDAAGELYTNPNLGGSIVQLPFENYELVVDTFYNCSVSTGLIHPTKNLNQSAFNLVCRVQNIEISMLGVPASLVGKSFVVVPFFKVSHNYPLT